MLNLLGKLLEQHKIELYSPISLRDCRIIRPYKLEKCGFGQNFDKLNAIMLAVPYYTECKDKNLSAYAIPRDYHLYFKSLFDDILPKLRKNYTSYKFFGFTDNSPIDEVEASARAGLGVIGANRMLITEKYSSFVFLGEIITDMPTEANCSEIKYCSMCGKCKNLCPIEKTKACISCLTQKKGELDENEKTVISECGSVWGCDICQEVCPYTSAAIKRGTIYTPIDFFKDELIPHLTVEILDSMSDEEFSSRAYSWRGRETIRRNLLLNKGNKN